MYCAQRRPAAVPDFTSDDCFAHYEAAAHDHLPRPTEAGAHLSIVIESQQKQELREQLHVSVQVLTTRF